MSEPPTRVASHGPTGTSPVVAYGWAGPSLVISHRSTGVNPVVAGKTGTLIRTRPEIDALPTRCTAANGNDSGQKVLDRR